MRRWPFGLCLLLACTAPSNNKPADEDVVHPWALDSRPSNSTCVAPARPVQDSSVMLERAFPSLTFSQPVFLTQAPGDGSRWYVVERTGRIHVFNNDPAVSTASEFVDLRDRLTATAGEAGLLGMAFHPNYAQNRQIFLSYTAPGSGGFPLVSRISRFTTDDGGNTLNKESEEILLTENQPYDNHNGGHIAFGPDGFLYIGLGDGGSGGDPINAGQRLDTLLGKILRIDVDNGTPYAIPEDNPLSEAEGRREIYAWGFRNPWRFSFDRAAGTLWAGDVGQNAWEEIDIVQRGGNYGWRVREGTHCYNAQTCETAGLIDPVAEYDHSLGRSVTGGYVYQGSSIPSLVGTYLYGDFESGRIWGLFPNATSGVLEPRLLLESGQNIASFAEGQDGEVYVLGFSNGRILQFKPAGTTQPDAFPQRLSETGCVDASDPTRVASGLIPYDVNVPFWSDGADKERWLAVPDGETIDVQPDGALVLPIGSVLVKSFRIGGQLVETRLLVRHDDGEWAGYTYEWNDAQTDATLLRAGKRRDVQGQTWIYPSRADCLTCHNAAAGRTLGLEVAQLNGVMRYPNGKRANQLASLEHIGMVELPTGETPDTLVAHPATHGDAPLEERARAYLEVNCAYCHRPGGPGQGDMDLRIETAPGDLNVCNVAPQEGTLGIDGGMLMVPGDGVRSVLLQRMTRRDAHGMPPIGSTRVDDEGVALIRGWIDAQTGCP